MPRTFAAKTAALFTAIVLLSAILTLVVPGTPTVTAQGSEGPPPPTALRVLERPEDAGLRIGLTWDVQPGDFGYQVYRSESAAGPFEQVGGKAADSMADYPVFMDETAVADTTYYYSVSTLDEEWREGPLSAPLSACLDSSFRKAVGDKSIVCSITDQRLYYFEGSQLVNILRCSTGLTGNTPTGHFHVLQHIRLNVGCDYWMSFTSAHGMHGWPRYIGNHEEGLGAPASHGCIREHPLEAYWPYNWAPNGTPVTVTYASYSRRVVNGCHSTIGATQPSTDWYFAEGYTAGDFETWLLLANPGDAAAATQVDFLLEGGATVRQEYNLDPHTRFSLPVGEVPGLEEAAFSIHVHALQPVVAERAMYFFYNGKSDGSNTIGATQLSSDWYFAEGCTAGEFDTYLLLANTGDAAVTAQVDFLPESGATVRQNYTIAPHSRFTVPVDGVPGMEEAAFSTHVQATGPIIAERAMYFRKGYTDGGHVSIGAPQPSLQWHFAEGCTRDFFESYILLGNDEATDALVDIDFFLPGGNVRHSFSVAAHSRLTIPIQSLPGLDYQDMAYSVYSSIPIVAEQAQYYSLDSHKGGEATIGSTQPSVTWYFAEGYTGGAFDTWLLMSNPGGTSAQTVVTFAREDGANFDYYFTIEPWRRLNVHVDELTGLEEASFSIVVKSDNPIVAERAMYFVIPRGY
jgi:hypothetical protein